MCLVLALCLRITTGVGGFQRIYLLSESSIAIDLGSWEQGTEFKYVLLSWAMDSAFILYSFPVLTVGSLFSHPDRWLVTISQARCIAYNIVKIAENILRTQSTFSVYLST